MGSRAAVLCYGLDPQLLKTRGWVLAQAGFEVVNCYHLGMLEELLASRDFHLLLLCHTLSPGDSRAALDLSARRAPATRRLLLASATAAPGALLPEAQPNRGPAELVATVQYLTRP